MKYDQSRAAHQLITQLFSVQKRQMQEWQNVLKREVYDFLVEKIDVMNVRVADLMLDGEKFDIYNEVKRGSTIDELVCNFKHIEEG